MTAAVGAIGPRARAPRCRGAGGGRAPAGRLWQLAAWQRGSQPVGQAEVAAGDRGGGRPGPCHLPVSAAAVVVTPRLMRRSVELLRQLKSATRPSDGDDRVARPEEPDEGTGFSFVHEARGDGWRFTNTRGRVVRQMSPVAMQAVRAWIPGDRIDIETHDGWERGAFVVGPSASGDPQHLRVRFQDGVEDDWDVAEFHRPRTVGSHGSAAAAGYGEVPELPSASRLQKARAAARARGDRSSRSSCALRWHIASQRTRRLVYGCALLLITLVGVTVGPPLWHSEIAWVASQHMRQELGLTMLPRNHTLGVNGSAYDASLPGRFVVQSGPCQVTEHGRCVGRPHGYQHALLHRRRQRGEKCEIVVRAGGPLALSRVFDTVDYGACEAGTCCGGQGRAWAARRDGVRIGSTGKVFSGGASCGRHPPRAGGVCNGPPPWGMVLATGETLVWSAKKDADAVLACNLAVGWARSVDMAGWQLCFEH